MDFFEFLMVFLGGIAFTVAFLWFSEKRALSIVRTRYAQKASEAKEELSEEMTEAITEALAVLKDETVSKDEKMKKLLEIGLRHPKVAARLLKAAQKGNIGDLIGLAG